MGGFGRAPGSGLLDWNKGARMGKVTGTRLSLKVCSLLLESIDLVRAPQAPRECSFVYARPELTELIGQRFTFELSNGRAVVQVASAGDEGVELTTTFCPLPPALPAADSLR